MFHQTNHWIQLQSLLDGQGRAVRNFTGKVYVVQERRRQIDSFVSFAFFSSLIFTIILQIWRRCSMLGRRSSICHGACFLWHQQRDSLSDGTESLSIHYAVHISCCLLSDSVWTVAGTDWKGQSAAQRRRYGGRVKQQSVVKWTSSE